MGVVGGVQGEEGAQDDGEGVARSGLVLDDQNGVFLGFSLHHNPSGSSTHTWPHMNCQANPMPCSIIYEVHPKQANLKESGGRRPTARLHPVWRSEKERTCAVQERARVGAPCHHCTMSEASDGG